MPARFQPDLETMSIEQEPQAGSRAHGMTVFFVALAVASAAALWWRDGGGVLAEALRHAGGMLLGIAPVIIVALFIGGYVQVLLPRRLVTRWLGDNSGAAGYLLATVAGVITPAGPFGAFPLVVALRHAGAPFDTCVVYLSAWATLGLHRIVIWELPFLGPDFVLLRVLVSLPLPIVAGLTARALARRLA